MKVHIFLILSMLLVLSIADISNAQNQRREITQKEIPEAVVMAIQADFPMWDMKMTKWYTDSKETQGWAPRHNAIRRYVVGVKGKNYRVRAVYDDTGKLLYSRTIASNVVLPRAILKKISADPELKSWKITKNKEFIRDYRQDKRIYRVYFEKDGKRRTQHFDRMGNKVKRARMG